MPKNIVIRKFLLFFHEVRIELTIFALPFAYLSLILVENGLPNLQTFIWITLAMIGIRNFGMGINRVIDYAIDAKNPRTSNRALVNGSIRKWEMTIFLILMAIIFIYGVYNLSFWAKLLSPVAILLVIAYPYAKRVTWASHLVLGIIYASVPNGVYIAVTNQINLESVLLGIGVGFWSAGFDVIYSTADIEIDRSQGLYSIPAIFGISKALLIAKFFHAGTIIFLTLAGIILGSGVIYYIGIIAFLILILIEHRMVSSENLSRINTAFFNMNGLISILFFFSVFIDTIYNN